MSETGRIDYSPDYKSEKPTFTAFDGSRGSFVEVFERNDAEIRRRLLEMSDGTATERARLERAVVEAAKVWRTEKRRIAGTTYERSTQERLLIEADKAFWPAVDALLEFEAKQK